jgi:hypothetical protein
MAYSWRTSAISTNDDVIEYYIPLDVLTQPQLIAHVSVCSLRDQCW